MPRLTRNQGWKKLAANGRLDACRWCGNKLTNGGRYKDKYFCGLRCGYQFGLAQAKAGYTVG